MTREGNAWIVSPKEKEYLIKLGLLKESSSITLTREQGQKVLDKIYEEKSKCQEI